MTFRSFTAAPILAPLAIALLPLGTAYVGSHFAISRDIRASDGPKACPPLVARICRSQLSFPLLDIGAMSLWDSDFVARAIGVTAAALFLWLVFRPKYDVMIRIRRGECRLTQGKLTAAHLKVVAEICAEHGIQEGWIGTIRRDRRSTLRFSKNVPEECRQQLRNLWPVHA
jgi:hypothetical protein